MLIKDFLSADNFYFLFNYLQDYSREQLNYQLDLSENKKEIGKFMEVIYENNYNSMDKKTANAIVITEFKRKIKMKSKRKFLQVEKIDNFNKVKNLRPYHNLNTPPEIVSNKFNSIFKNQAKEIDQDFIVERSYDFQNMFKDVLKKLEFKEHDLSKAPINMREELLIPQPDIFKGMFDKPLYIENALIFIDSRDRNHDLYTNSHDYSIKLDAILKNVISIELLQATIPNSEYLINDTNNTIYFQETSGTTITAQIDNGNYTVGSTIASNLETAMNTSGSSVYSVLYNSSTNKFTISSDRTGGSGDFLLKFAGSNEIFSQNQTRSKYLDNSIGKIIGFSNTNLANASSHTSQNNSNFAPDRSVYMYINADTKNSFDNIEGINKSDFGKFMKLGLVSDFGEYTYWLNSRSTVANQSDKPNKNPYQKVPEESDINKINKNESDFKLFFNPPISIDRLTLQFKNYDQDLFNFYGLENSLLFRIEMFNFHYENIVLDYKFPELSNEIEIEYTKFPDKLDTIIEEVEI